MAPEAAAAIEHNIFTPGNYFYNGIGHVTVDYGKVMRIGYKGIIAEVQEDLNKCNVYDADYAKRHEFLESIIISCNAVINYARRYANLAYEMAQSVQIDKRNKKKNNCDENPRNFKACQTFWFIQMLLQIESSGHSISAGRFDQYLYPYYKNSIDNGSLMRKYLTC